MIQLSVESDHRSNGQTTTDRSDFTPHYSQSSIILTPKATSQLLMQSSSGKIPVDSVLDEHYTQYWRANYDSWLGQIAGREKIIKSPTI